jgi:hypothetical protein
MKKLTLKKNNPAGERHTNRGRYAYEHATYHVVDEQGKVWADVVNVGGWWILNPTIEGSMDRVFRTLSEVRSFIA